MVKKFLHKRSKRMPARRRYKIEKRVRDHNRKVKKQEKKNPNKQRPKKDPGVPNKFPFKEKVLQEAAARKQRAEDEKKRMKENRHKLVTQKRSLTDIKQSAEKRSLQFENKKKKSKSKRTPTDGSQKAYYKEFKKVIEAADVILEVLDARDPLGSRCPQVEEAVINSGTNKRLVLILNKIDLIPKPNLIAWLKYLRNELPTIAFKASTQKQKNRLSQNRRSAVASKEKMVQSSNCLGASTLMKLLGNYGRTQDLKTTISVGVVGFPNVGKSSIINSLKRNRVCNVGATPGVTRSMQEIQLDKHVVLLDSPGVVLAKSDGTMSALKNAVKVERIADPVAPVEAILKRIKREDIMMLYHLPQFASTHEFLALMAKRYGRVKKGGVADVEMAARLLINDWNTGKIKYFTHPPETHELPHYISAEIVKTMSEAFEVDTSEKLKGVPKSLNNTVQMETTGPTDCADEQLLDEAASDEDMTEDALVEKDEDEMDEESEVEEDKDGPENNPAAKRVEVAVVKKSMLKIAQDDEIPKHLRKKAKLLDSALQLEGNQKLNKAAKVVLKKMNKAKRKSDQRTAKLSDAFDSCLTFSASNNDSYDFKTDYK